MAYEDMDEAALRSLLRPRRSPPLPVTKGKQWVMTDTDLAAFTRILRGRFPSIRFLETTDVMTDDGKKLRRPLEWPTDAEFEAYAIVPGDGLGHKTEFRLTTGEVVRGPYFRLRRCHLARWRDPQPPAVNGNLLESIMQGEHARSDGDAARFLARVWRAAEKISVNKVKMIDRETGATIWPRIHGPWCGFDALRWCREEENRVLNSSYRPTDDWVMPDSPYYD